VRPEDPDVAQLGGGGVLLAQVRRVVRVAGVAAVACLEVGGAGLVPEERRQRVALAGDVHLGQQRRLQAGVLARHRPDAVERRQRRGFLLRLQVQVDHVDVGYARAQQLLDPHVPVQEEAGAAVHQHRGDEPDVGRHAPEHLALLVRVAPEVTRVRQQVLHPLLAVPDDPAPVDRHVRLAHWPSLRACPPVSCCHRSTITSQ
jgi:hypothetical protein